MQIGICVLERRFLLGYFYWNMNISSGTRI